MELSSTGNEVEDMLSIRLSANRFAFKPMDERLTDVMDGITDGMETLAEGDAALGFARLATAGLRVMLPEKNQSSVAMDLVLRSTRKALERFAAHVPGGQKDISFKKEVNARVFECNAYTINMDFFLRPGTRPSPERFWSIWSSCWRRPWKTVSPCAGNCGGCGRGTSPTRWSGSMPEIWTSMPRCSKS